MKIDKIQLRIYYIIKIALYCQSYEKKYIIWFQVSRG